MDNSLSHKCKTILWIDLDRDRISLPIYIIPFLHKREHELNTDGASDEWMFSVHTVRWHEFAGFIQSKKLIHDRNLKTLECKFIWSRLFGNDFL